MIVGGGYIGIEVAENLKENGLRIVFVCDERNVLCLLLLGNVYFGEDFCIHAYCGSRCKDDCFW